MTDKSSYLPFLYLALMVLILPLVYFKNSLDPVLLPRVFGLAIMLFITLTTMLLKFTSGKGAFSFAVLRGRIFHAFLFYIAFSLIALWGASNISEGIFEISKTVLGFSVLVTAALIFHNRPNTRFLLAKFMIACGFMLAVIGIFQYFGVGFGFLQGYGLPSGTSVNRNLFIALLAIILPYSFFGSFYLSKAWEVLSVIVGTTILFIIIIGSTRAVWVACALASLACLILYFVYLRGKAAMQVSGRTKKSRPAILAVSALIVLVVTAGFFITRNTPYNILSRAASIFDPEVPSNYTRVDLWKKSMSMIGDHPLIGVGPGNWKINIARYGPVGSPGIAQIRFFQRPHNDFLWVLSEKGIPGLISYLGIFGFAIYYALMIIIKSTGEKREQRFFALFMLWGIIAYLTDSFFSFPMERMLNFTFLMLMIAAIVSLHEDLRSGTKKDLPRVRKLAVIIPLLLGVGFSGIIGFVRLRSEIHTKIAMGYRAENDWSNVIREIRIAESEVANLDPTATPLAWYSGEAHYMLGDYDQAFMDYLRAYKYNPNHLHVLNNLATCYEIRGEHDKAIKFYNQALVANPDFPDALMNLAAVYYNTGRYDLAAEAISRVATDCSDPRYPLIMKKIKAKLK